MASCRQIETLLQGYIDGELSDSERVIMEEHVSDCRQCARMLKRHKRSTAALFELMEEYRLRNDLTPAVMAHLPEMDRSPLAVREVNWRVKHTASRWGQLVRLMPALAPAAIVILAVALIYSWPRNGEIPTDTIGLVTFRNGDVMRSSDVGTDRTSVHLRSYVTGGDRFETGSSAALMLSLAGPTEIKAAQNTRMQVRDEREVTVEKGRAWLHVGKDVRLFRVKTPMGDVVVFGTTFDVLVEEDRSIVTCADGRVQVDNGVAFRELNPGDQVVLMVGKKPLEVQTVDPTRELAWADAISPDSGAKELFASAVTPKVVASMAADQVFVVQTNGRAVQSLTFEWKTSGGRPARNGYYVHVYDDHMNLLFTEYLKPEVIRAADRNSYDLVVPGKPIRDVRILHIKVMADSRTGESETSFTKVSAWGIYP